MYFKHGVVQFIRPWIQNNYIFSIGNTKLSLIRNSRCLLKPDPHPILMYPEELTFTSFHLVVAVHCKLLQTIQNQSCLRELLPWIQRCWYPGPSIDGVTRVKKDFVFKMNCIHYYYSWNTLNRGVTQALWSLISFDGTSVKFLAKFWTSEYHSSEC